MWNWLDEDLRQETLDRYARQAEARADIVVLGDSVVYGRGVPYEQAYPALLEAMLNKGQSGADAVRVINAGVGGNTVLQGWARLERHALRFRPKVVVLAFGLNDMHLGRSALDRWRAATFQWQGSSWGRVHRWALGSRAYRWVASRWQRMALDYLARTRPTEALQPRVPPHTMARCLTAMVARVRARACPILLTTTPLGPTYLPDWPSHIRARQFELQACYDALIRQVADEMDVVWIDVAGGLDGWNASTCLQADGIHPTTVGHQQIARLLASKWPPAV